MKVLLHSHFPAGHAYPMQAIAQSLVAHGHSVSWLTSLDNEFRVLATGATFISTNAIAAVDAPFMKENSTGLFDEENRCLDSRLIAQVADYRAALAHFAADVLLVDILPHGARAMYELGEIPVYATLGVIPLYTSRLGAPLAGSGCIPPASWAEWFVNAARQIVSRWAVLLFHLRPVINRQRKELGLANLSLGETMEDFTYSPHLHIQASSLTLEFNQRPNTTAHQKHTVFVGPLVTKAMSGPPKLPPWWSELPATKKIIGITQGTLAMDPTSLILPSINALKDNPDLFLIVVSPYINDIEHNIGHRDNIRYATWLPYDILLPRLSLLITNGGYGSITQALSHGVPLLCAGQSEDKRDTAARVAFSRVGIDLRTDSPEVRDVREAAYTILGDEGYGARAKTLGDELIELGGAEAAVDALEALVQNNASKR